ncbi:MAG: ubiquinone anaerobic biosynthesis accessory factor UbiT [Thermomonas sp.]
MAISRRHAAPALAGVRHAIDAVDDALLGLLAGRGVLVRHAAKLKRATGHVARDHAREAHVHARATSLARRLGLPDATARRLIELAIADACLQQGLADDMDQRQEPGEQRMLAVSMSTSHASASTSTSAGSQWLLRRLPPPARLAPLLRLVPEHLRGQLLERAMARVLAEPLATGELEFMQGRRLGIEVTDLDLRWVIECQDNQLVVCTEPAEASVRGTTTDLLLLASRLEDADTLFFQRRLTLTGDTELGLTVRNLLERLPWESVPLGLRIALNRGARLARAARAAYHDHA